MSLTVTIYIKYDVMFRKPWFVTLLVSACLVFFHALINTGTLLWLAGTIFLLSPLLIAWLAYTILKHGKYHGSELGQHEEWGYQDRDRNSLDTF